MGKLSRKFTPDKIACKHIREKRKKLGWIQADVGEWIGVDRSTYNRKERGLTVLTADELLIILQNFSQRGQKIKKPQIEKLLPDLI